MPSLATKAPFNALSILFPRLIWRDGIALGSCLHAIMWNAVPSKLFHNVIAQETDAKAVMAILNEYDISIILYHLARRHNVNLCSHNIEEIREAYYANRKKEMKFVANELVANPAIMRLLLKATPAILKQQSDRTPYFGKTESYGYKLMWNRALWRIYKQNKKETSL